MAQLPGHFTIAAPGVRLAQELADLQDLAGEHIHIGKETAHDESETVYALTRPVPLSIARAICERLGVSVDGCRWGDGDMRLDWSFMLDMPLEPNGLSLLRDIGQEHGDGRLPGVMPLGHGNQTKLHGSSASNQHGLDTLLYGLRARGYALESFQARESQLGQSR